MSWAIIPATSFESLRMIVIILLRKELDISPSPLRVHCATALRLHAFYSTTLTRREGKQKKTRNASTKKIATKKMISPKVRTAGLALSGVAAGGILRVASRVSFVAALRRGVARRVACRAPWSNTRDTRKPVPAFLLGFLGFPWGLLFLGFLGFAFLWVWWVGRVVVFCGLPLKRWPSL